MCHTLVATRINFSSNCNQEDISVHLHLDCLFNSLLRLISKETSKLPLQRASKSGEAFPGHDVIMLLVKWPLVASFIARHCACTAFISH